jgi:CrcB protein
MVWVGVVLLGGVGALARFFVDGIVSERTGALFPWGTMVVNLSGAFVLGILTGLALKGDALLLGGTALLGSYTTFSTWMLESQRLGEDGAGRAAIVNVVVSIAIGMVAVVLGRALGELL